MNCGSRAATVRAIQIRDVDLDGGVVFYRHTKNRKAQVIPLCSPMVAILREYGRYRGGEPTDYLFCTETGTQLTENGLRQSIARYNTRRGVQMMAFVRAGDTVVVESISRIARNTRDLLSIVSELTEKGVEFVSLKENIDTTTPQGRFMLTVFGALAELERENILERQREGIEIAKSEGKYKGRKPIDYDEAQMKALCKKWRAGEITATAAMKELGLKPNTFYRRVKEMGL